MGSSGLKNNQNLKIYIESSMYNITEKILSIVLQKTLRYVLWNMCLTGLHLLSPSYTLRYAEMFTSSNLHFFNLIEF